MAAALLLHSPVNLVGLEGLAALGAFLVQLDGLGDAGRAEHVPAHMGRTSRMCRTTTRMDHPFEPLWLPDQRTPTVST